MLYVTTPVKSIGYGGHGGGGYGGGDAGGYHGPGDYGHDMSGYEVVGGGYGGGMSGYGYRKRMGQQKQSQKPYRKRRPTKDLNYASDVSHKQYQVFNLEQFIPNDKLYYY